MDSSCNRISVAVEKCQLCCYSKRPMICLNCIQSGNFSHSSDEFIAENYYVNKRKTWLEKNGETQELKKKLNEYLKEDQARKVKLQRVQQTRLRVTLAREAQGRLLQQLSHERQEHQKAKADNLVTTREILAIRTKLKNILEHLKKQPEKLESSCAKLQASRTELALRRKQLCSAVVHKIFPISHCTHWNPLPCHKEISEQEFKQLSVYLCKNALQPFPLSAAEATCNNYSTENTSNNNISSSLQSNNSSTTTLTDSQQPSTMHNHHQISSPFQHKTLSLPTFPSTSTPSFLPHQPSTCQHHPSLNPPPLPPPTNSTASHQTCNSSTNSRASSFQLLNTSAINLLKEARMTAFVDGRWVYSTEAEDSRMQILDTRLPCNLRLLPKHPHSNEMQAGLSLLAQLTTLLANILDCSLPRSLHFKEFSGDLTARQLARRLCKLESNVQWLCFYQNLRLSHRSSHCLHSIHSLLQSPLLGCDEANSGSGGEDEEEGVWISEAAGGEAFKKERDDDADENDIDDDDDDVDDDEVLLQERLARLPQRKVSFGYKPPCRNRRNSGSNGEGNWEYISPHVELIPEQMLSSSASSLVSSSSIVSSSDTIGASVGAYVSSWIHSWRS